MTTLVTFRLDDEDAAAIRYREGPKGVYHSQYGKPRTRRIPAEPVAVREEKDSRPQSAGTLTAADAQELVALIDQHSRAVMEAQWARGQDEVRAASKRTSDSYVELYGWICDHTDDWFELYRLQKAARESERASEANA